MFVPPLRKRSNNAACDWFASAIASLRLIAAPFFFIRSRMIAEEVARTGFMMELISGGAPSPDLPWQLWHMSRYRSAPLRVTVGARGPTCTGDALWNGDGPSCAELRPMLVSPKLRCRCSTQLGPVVGV